MIVRANQRGPRATVPVFLSSLVLLAAFALPPSAAAQEQAPCEAVDPAWSPDGAWILFASNCDGNLELYRVRPDGSELMRLTRTAGAEHTPRWSPDGRSVAYAYKDERRGSEIRLMDAEGGRPRALTDNAYAQWNPSWSPDGKQIAYESHREGSADIYVLNIEHRQELRLTHSGARSVAPAWSPDGSTIAFQSNAEGRYSILGIDPGGASSSRPLVRFDGQAVTVAWSSKGDRLVFACVMPGESDTELCVANVTQGSVERLTRNDRRDFAPVFAPDGQRVVFMASRAEGGWELRILSLRDASEAVLPLPNPAGGITPAPPPQGGRRAKPNVAVLDGVAKDIDVVKASCEVHA